MSPTDDTAGGAEVTPPAATTGLMVVSRKDTMFAGAQENMYRIWDIHSVEGDVTADAPLTADGILATLEAADPKGHFWVLREHASSRLSRADDDGTIPKVTCIAIEGHNRALVSVYELRPNGTPDLTRLDELVVRLTDSRLPPLEQQKQRVALLEEVKTQLREHEHFGLHRIATVKASNTHWIPRIDGDDYFEWRVWLGGADVSSPAAATYAGENQRFTTPGGVKGHLAFRVKADDSGAVIVQNQGRHGSLAVRVAGGHDARLFACLSAVKDKLQDTFPRAGGD